MSEQEKEIITRLSKTVQQLDEGNQKYLLGYAEGMAARENQANLETEDEPVSAAVGG